MDSRGMSLITVVYVPGWLWVATTSSARNYPASDTVPLRPDARNVESASPASCASWVAWQRPFKFHASGAKPIHHIPSWYISQSNSASGASRLVYQHHCSSWFTTERCSLQGYPWVFLGMVHHGFSAPSLTCNTLFSHHHPQYSLLSSSPLTFIFPGILHNTPLQLHSLSWIWHQEVSGLDASFTPV